MGAGSACTGVDTNGDMRDDACVRCDTCDQCDDGDVCTCDVCDSAVGFCDNPPRPYGDIDCSGQVNIFDLFCMLDGLNNIFTTCCKSNVDIAGSAVSDCNQNGSINIFDLFGLLDALNAINHCNCAAGPAPAQTQSQSRDVRRSDATAEMAQRLPASLLLIPKQKDMSAGGALEVDVFAGSVTNLRGYELRLHAEGGARGDLSVVDVRVDAARKNFVFTGQDAVVAPNVSGSRFVVALEQSVVSSRRPVYLGTFVLKSSRGARGAFELGIEAGVDTYLLDSVGKPLAVQNPEKVIVNVR